MASKLAPVLRRCSDSEPGLYLSVCQPSILQAIGCDTGGIDRATFPRYNTPFYPQTGFGKRRTGEKRRDRLLSIAEKISIFFRARGGRCVTSDARAAVGRRGVSILCVADYVGRKRGLAYGARKGGVRLGYRLPDVDKFGRGIRVEIW